VRNIIGEVASGNGLSDYYILLFIDIIEEFAGYIALIYENLDSQFSES